MGLSTTAAIIKSHGGSSTSTAKPGGETTFKIYLPANTASAAAQTVDGGKTELPRGNGELVLVADDENPIRMVAQKTPERFGYRVSLAGNGAEAVSITPNTRMGSPSS